ncbi:MAG: endonuclease/exonuclease/phosphatase family protein [bacterium]
MKYKMSISSIVIATLILFGCDQHSPVTPDFTGEDGSPTFAASQQLSRVGHGSGAVTVMTRNIYVGTNVDIVLSAGSPEQVPGLVAEAFQVLLSTNFPERAQALAKEIARSRPHLVGLQEVSLLRLQSPGDAIVGGKTPAEDVLFDYLAILLDALRSRGLHYKIAGKIRNADVEVPMVVSLDPLAFDDVRLTDFDVVLARNDVGIARVTEQNYQAKLTIPNLGITIPRGFVAVDARVGKKTYRFANTHLEPAVLAVKSAQAQELAAALENDTLPVILVGDLNTEALTGAVYQFFESQGYVDAWTQNIAARNRPGFTCCHDSDLRNTAVDLDERIDLVFVRNQGGTGPVFAFTVGDKLRDRTPSGLWPSDHAGVVAKLRIPGLQVVAQR